MKRLLCEIPWQIQDTSLRSIVDDNSSINIQGTKRKLASALIFF